MGLEQFGRERDHLKARKAVQTMLESGFLEGQTVKYKEYSSVAGVKLGNSRGRG